jgi:hypothetical protein
MTTAIQIIQFILTQCVIELIYQLIQPTRDIESGYEVQDIESLYEVRNTIDDFAESYAIDINDAPLEFPESVAITIDESPVKFTAINFECIELDTFKLQQVEFCDEPVVRIKTKLIRPHLHSRWAKTPRTGVQKRTFTTVFGTTYSLPTKLQ